MHFVRCYYDAFKSLVLWKDVIRCKCGEGEGGWSYTAVSGGHGVGLCKAIRKRGHFILNKLSFVVRNGQRVKFGKE